MIPLLGFMPVGSFILRRATPNLFDKVILIILVGVAIRLFMGNLADTLRR